MILHEDGKSLEATDFLPAFYPSSRHNQPPSIHPIYLQLTPIEAPNSSLKTGQRCGVQVGPPPDCAKGSKSPSVLMHDLSLSESLGWLE
jgi:hypothetical protein